MSLKQLLTAVAYRLRVTAQAYSGTKTADLSAFVTSLVPSIKVRRVAGAPTKDPSRWQGLVDVRDAYKLGERLINAGWQGKKGFKILKATDYSPEIKLEFVRYQPTDIDSFKFTPQILLYKPDRGDTKTRILLQHATTQSLVERNTQVRLRKGIGRPGRRF